LSVINENLREEYLAKRTAREKAHHTFKVQNAPAGRSLNM